MIDFLIVGRGLAAWTLAHKLTRFGKSFIVVGDNSLSRSSYVAAGIWNPVVFKRMTGSWMAEKLVPELQEFYGDCEKKLKAKFLYRKNIIKPFVEEQEKTLWLKKSKNELTDFLSSTINSTVPENMSHCNLKGEYGTVLNSGNVDLAVYLEKSEDYYKDKIIHESFEHKKLKIYDNHISYKDLTAQKIVFCEGHLVKENPYFNWLPMNPAKGEVLIIESEADPGDTIFNRDGFILKTPAGNKKAGATYEWKELNDIPTAKGETQLRSKLEKLINAPYTIVKHEAGVRPSSSDRRPLLGKHPEFHQLLIFNGMGTKGVMLAPYFANNFVLFCLEKQEINPEADIKRFYSLYKGAC